MTEREVFKELIPQITEMIQEIEQIPLDAWEKFKVEWIEQVKANAPTAEWFIRKLILVIDTYLKENAA